MTTRTISVGDFIEIPAWKVEGLVIATRTPLPSVCTVDAQEVLVERKPDDPSPRWYRLEPDEFIFDYEAA